MLRAVIVKYGNQELKDCLRRLAEMKARSYHSRAVDRSFDETGFRMREGRQDIVQQED